MKRRTSDERHSNGKQQISIGNSMDEIGAALPLSPKVKSESEKMVIDRDLNSATTLNQSDLEKSFGDKNKNNPSNNEKQQHQKNTKSTISDSYPARGTSHNRQIS